MKTLKIKYLLAIGLLFGYTAFAGNSFTKTDAGDMPSKSIVEIAVDDNRFSILVDALSKAELVDALSATGPFTVFAPTNDAFEALFSDLGIEGISDLSKEQLTPILLYHVVQGKVMAKDVKSGEVPTLNSDAWIKVKVSDNGVTINKNSNVIVTDVKGTNGVIHVIDKVLLP